MFFLLLFVMLFFVAQICCKEKNLVLSIEISPYFHHVYRSFSNEIEELLKTLFLLYFLIIFYFILFIFPINKIEKLNLISIYIYYIFIYFFTVAAVLLQFQLYIYHTVDLFILLYFFYNIE